jgi:hypothetical protein
MKPGSKFLTVVYPLLANAIVLLEIELKLGEALSVVVVLANLLLLLGCHIMAAVLHVQMVVVACYLGSLAAFCPRSGLDLLILSVQMCKCLKSGARQSCLVP